MKCKFSSRDLFKEMKKPICSYSAMEGNSHNLMQSIIFCAFESPIENRSKANAKIEMRNFSSRKRK